MKRLTKIVIIVVVLGIAIYVPYNRIHRWHERSLDTALKEERNELWDNIGKLEEQIANLEEELAQEREAVVPKEKLVEVFGEEPTVASPEAKEISCAELERQIIAFFTYLDNKEYVKAYGLEGGTYELFQQIVKQLSEDVPVVTGETKDLYSLTRNLAHFYRVLGGKRVELITDVMKNESEIIESVMATFFTWFTSCDSCKEALNRCPSLEVSYDYAGFFLNTLAGKSYLLRRDSKVRILASYYCILILDRANKETLNRHGIDIRPHIGFSLYDIKKQKGFIYQSQYQRKLESLKKKYKL